jgi:hypothetical protein
MLNVPESVVRLPFYRLQKEITIRFLSYFFGVILFVEFLRAQTPEIDVLQLVPGYFLLLVFVSLILIISISNYVFKLPRRLECKKDLGTKTSTKMELFLIIKFGYLLVSSLLITLLVLILPISLDSFEDSGDHNLESLWAFQEIIGLEIILASIVLSLSQLPNLTIFSLTIEKDLQLLPENWQDFSFLSFVVSGVITPTIDGYTQVSFAFSALSLYLVILTMATKRGNQKFLGSRSQNF